MSKKINIEELLGKTLISISKTSDQILFRTIENEVYKMYHDQDCCESVYIEDVIGELDNLLNNPITMAEEIISDKNPDDIKKENQDCFTWTFYKLATVKGYVTIRWYGTSNGYYSESVDFAKI